MRGKIFIILLCMILPIFPRLPIQPTQINRTFTWISHPINSTMALWLYNMHFTDVVIRYVPLDQINATKENLAIYGIALWYTIAPWCFCNCTTVEDFKQEVSYQIQDVGVDRLVLDDIHLLFNGFTETQRTNFLRAIENFGNSILLTFYEPYIYYLSQYDFSKINVDIYCLPTQFNVTATIDARIQVKTLGIYLWLWNGNGLNWSNVSNLEIIMPYCLALRANANRIYVWMGDEDNTHEQGMSLSSLYNYPQQWRSIASLNLQFLKYNKMLSRTERFKYQVIF